MLRKTYDTPQTPFPRVLASPFLPLKAKEQLSALKARYDPVQLRYELDLALEKLRQVYSYKEQVEWYGITI